MKTKETAAVTERFRKAISHVIAESIRTGGSLRANRHVAEYLGTSQANYSKQTNGGSVTLWLLIAACKKFNINPTWLILGKGEIFTDGTDRLSEMDERLSRLENEFKTNRKINN